MFVPFSTKTKGYSFAGYQSEMVTPRKRGDCFRASTSFEGKCSKNVARGNKKEYKTNDRGARSCSRSFVYYSRCYAKHCSGMVAGLFWRVCACVCGGYDHIFISSWIDLRNPSFFVSFLLLCRIEAFV
jgi:hypothetical protein